MSGQTNPGHVKRFAEARITAVLFLLPAVIIFAVFVIWPILQSARYSAYSWNGLGSPTQFVGLHNYEQLLGDPVFFRALSNNIFVLAWSLFIQIPLAILLAILLTGQIRGSIVFRTIYIAPLVLSSVVVGLLWQWVFNPTFGLANSLLQSIGLQQYESSWLGNADIVLACVMVASTWRDLGFYLVIYIAAIQGIPDELYQAAKVDGANYWQLHRYMTLPLLNTATRTVLVLCIVGSLRFFDLVWVMTGGGPYHSSEVLATYMFKAAFQSREWGYASALAFVLFSTAFALVIAFLVFSQTRKQFD